MATDRSGALFRGIADPVRRAILELLGDGPRAVEEIASHFPVSRPAISRHLKVLKEAGLLAEERSGRQRYYNLRADRLGPVREWLESVGGAVAASASPTTARRPERGRATRPVADEPREDEPRSTLRSRDWRSW